MRPSMLAGIIAAVLASAAWSLGFIAPFVIGPYSLFDFALVEFIFSGIIGLGLLWKHAAAVRQLRLRDWLAAFRLGVIGYLGYFLAVMGAAVYAGPVIAPAFLGLVPVVLAIAGNFRERHVAWRALGLPLTLSTVGLLLVNGSGLAQSNAIKIPSPLLGISLAVLAVALWTAFGLLNQSALAKRPTMDAGVWTALIMVGAGVATLIFIPLGLAAHVFEIPRLGLRWELAAPLLLWAAALAVLANVGGALAWTFASQRLPVTLAAQLITMEPTFGTVFGLLVHRRWPSTAEAIGMIILLTGVVLAIRLFSRPRIEPPQAGTVQAS